MIDPRYIDLLIYRSIASLKTEVSRHYLGVIWWVLEPVLYMLVFYMIFDLGLRQGGPGFVPFLLCGLVSWKWFDSTVRTSSGAIMSSAGLIGQVYFPKYLIPASVVLANTFKFVLLLIVFVPVLMLTGSEPGLQLLWIPIVLLTQFLLTCAIALLVAALIPLLPDLGHLVNYGMTMAFFMSGIFFDINTMSEKAQVWFSLNPMVTLLDAWRAILLRGESPDIGALAIVAACSLLLMPLVAAVYRRFDRLYPKVLA